MIIKRFVRLAVLFGIAVLLFAPVAKADLYDDAVLNYRRGDYVEATAIFEKLANQGDARAQFWLGTMWYQGRGKPRNYREAFRWYRQSAYLGNSDSQNNLGLIYRNGEAQEPNFVVAYAWFSLAKAQNNDVADRNLESLASTMTKNEILQGQQLTQEYLVRIDNEKRKSHPVPVADNSVVPLPPLERRTLPLATTSSGFGRAISDNQEYYMVQLGLFQNPHGIKSIQHTLRRHRLQVEQSAVEIRGKEFQRFRVGPYQTASAAQAVAGRLNKLFKLKSAVIPLLK
ncbi:MAG: SPOR domain-containing protein [Rhodospirillaceae bacterium]